MSDLFTHPDHVAAYAKYRPVAPQIVIDKILAYLKEKHDGPLTRALDVGCGSGQSTRILAPYFDQVTGLDVSETQIQQAKLNPENPVNVEFAASVAESLPFEDNSAQLVTASSAFHWFDQERFIQETKRVLEPNGVLAVYRKQTFLRGNTEEETENLRAIVLRYNEVYLKKHRDSRSSLAILKDVVFPMNDFVRNDDIEIHVEMPFMNYVHLQTTFSVYYKLVREVGEAEAKRHLAILKLDLLRELGASEDDAEQLMVKITYKYTLLMGRK